MRAIVAALATLGGGVILAAFMVSVARGDGSEAEWLLLPLHGWVHGGHYHQLAPAFPLSYPGAGSR
jgi:hypothetical protein